MDIQQNQRKRRIRRNVPIIAQKYTCTLSHFSKEK